MNRLSSIAGVEYFRDEPMARHTSLRIGGKARHFLKVHSCRALKTVVEYLKCRRMRYFVIGAGTNLLVSDRGIRQAVIQLCGGFAKMSDDGSGLICGSAVRMNRLVEKAALHGYGGVEFLAGIPGTIGGGIKGNAGAFGRSFADIVDSVSVLTPANKIRVLNHEQIGFRYRGSGIPDSKIILFARLRLLPKTRRSIRMDIARSIAYRKERQPRQWSAGSFFKNPKRCPAGKLIDVCGLKGRRVGDAQISNKHANFIINRGHATAKEVMALAAIVERKVLRKTGIRLQKEVRILK